MKYYSMKYSSKSLSIVTESWLSSVSYNMSYNQSQLGLVLTTTSCVVFKIVKTTPTSL